MGANESLLSVCDAGLFDLDGVLTPTADVHMRAWARMFNSYLRARAAANRTPPPAPYTDEDYFRYVDGKPRYDGVRDFLASRGIGLPLGNPTDSPDTETICGLGNRKNDSFAHVLATEGIRPYPGSVRFLDYLHNLGIPVAVVSSSQNAPVVLAAAGLGDRFEVVVDAAVARREHLKGKPSPETYAFAAAALGVPKERAVVFDDAVSGVAAGRAGDFALVIGIDRGVGAEALTEAGADLVVSDLAELLP